MIVEIIVTTDREAAVAESAGASRLELIARRDLGGLTPEIETVRAVLRAVRIPVYVMVRSHERGFVYRDAELREMREAAQRFREAGAHGLVFGALLPDKSIDMESLHELADAAGRAPMTFHRAFDACRDPHEAFGKLGSAGFVERVLTSGRAESAPEGKDLLREMAALPSAVSVLAGGGLNAQNIAPLIAYTGVREVHVGSGARSGDDLDARKITEIVRRATSNTFP